MRDTGNIIERGGFEKPPLMIPYLRIPFALMRFEVSLLILKQQAGKTMFPYSD